MVHTPGRGSSTGRTRTIDVGVNSQPPGHLKEGGPGEGPQWVPWALWSNPAKPKPQPPLDPLPQRSGVALAIVGVSAPAVADARLMTDDVKSNSGLPIGEEGTSSVLIDPITIEQLKFQVVSRGLFGEVRSAVYCTASGYGSYPHRSLAYTAGRAGTHGHHNSSANTA